MKNLLTKSFGVLGLVIYYIFFVAVRIPVGIFLFVFLGLFLLIWVPACGNDSTNNWLGSLYEWYCGK